MEESIQIGQSELETLLGKPIVDYALPNFPTDFEHGVIHPHKLLNMILERGIRKEIGDLSPVNEELYRSGEIWLGAYDTLYFYLGRTSNGKDVLVNLGGDTFDAGSVHIGTIYDKKYGLHQRIFPSRE